MILGEGAISRNPEKPAYRMGETVTVGAFPADGWRFSQWLGDASGDDPIVQIVVDGDMTVIATFVQVADKAFVYLPVVGRSAP